MKIKEGFVLRKTAGRDVVVSMGKDYNGFCGIITLTGLGAFYWNLLQSEQTVESLVAEALKEYNVTADTAKADLLEFLEKLKDADILE